MYMFSLAIGLFLLVVIPYVAFMVAARKIAKMDIKKEYLKPGDLTNFQLFVRNMFFYVEDMTPEEKAKYDAKQEKHEKYRQEDLAERRKNEVIDAIYMTRPMGNDRF